MHEYGLKTGRIHIRSAGPIAFGPAGILFLADNAAAKIFAVDVGDPAHATTSDPFDFEDLDTRVGAFLGCGPTDLKIRDLAVHPASRKVYLSVQRGLGDEGQLVVVRLDPVDGSISDLPLDAVAMAEISLGDAPAANDDRLDTTLPLAPDEGEEVTYGDHTFRLVRQPIRTATVTDMAYVDGYLLVAGLSNEEFASKLRRIPFPFGAESMGNNLEIFHVSHGQWETAAPIRTFVPYQNGQAILASYTCTPVVHFLLTGLEPGTKTIGRTVAELGAVNQPLDMVTFVDAEGEHLLVANSAHGLIKIACADIDGQDPLTEPKQPVGVPREVEDLQGIVRLANLDADHVLAIQVDGAGHYHLRSLKTASL